MTDNKTEKKAGRWRVAAQAARRIWQRFTAWQKRRPAVAALSTDSHRCLNCGNEYTGNFCPRCGQSGAERDLSWKHVLERTFEVWGLGSRSMPRTLWHLIYRPGYMIRDYITGHRMPYFPPVKMLFVLTAAYALTLHLTRPEASSTVQSNHPSVAVEISNDSTQTEPSFSLSVTHADKANDSEKTKAAAQGQWSDNVLDRAFQFLDRNYALQLILSHAIFAIAALWLFRNPRHGKRMSLTEHFFAQIYIACQLMAISVVYCILSGAKSRLSLLYDMPLPAVLLIMCYDYKQLYGYSTIKTIWKTLLTVVIWAVVLFAILFIIAFVLKMAEQLSAIY